MEVCGSINFYRDKGSNTNLTRCVGVKYVPSWTVTNNGSGDGLPVGNCFMKYNVAGQDLNKNAYEVVVGSALNS